MARPDANPHLTRRQAENVRAAIKVGNIVDRLEKCAAGDIQMTPTQVQAAKILVDKCIPSLQATDMRVQGRYDGLSTEALVGRRGELVKQRATFASRVLAISGALVDEVS